MKLDLNFVDNIIDGIVEGADRLFTSDEEKLEKKRQLKSMLLSAKGQLITGIIDFSKSFAESQAEIIKAEAGGESWLQRNWRPLTMLVFVGLVVAHWLGYTAENLSPAQVSDLMDIVKIGVGGYITSRGVEKSISIWKGKRSK